MIILNSRDKRKTFAPSSSNNIASTGEFYIDGIYIQI